MESELQTIYLGLGSNLGDRQAFLKSAIIALAPEVLLLKCSPLYETQPWGFDEQGKFINLVLKAQTSLSPLDLLGKLKNLEQEVGRKASFPNGPREIDIDILFYADQIIEQDALSIPHPKLHERAFVLGPLSDLAPDLIHPGLAKPVIDLKKAVDMSSIHRLSEMEICTEIIAHS